MAPPRPGPVKLWARPPLHTYCVAACLPLLPAAPGGEELLALASSSPPSGGGVPSDECVCMGRRCLLAPAGEETFVPLPLAMGSPTVECTGAELAEPSGWRSCSRGGLAPLLTEPPCPRRSPPTATRGSRDAPRDGLRPDDGLVPHRRSSLGTAPSRGPRLSWWLARFAQLVAPPFLFENSSRAASPTVSGGEGTSGLGLLVPRPLVLGAWRP